MVQDAPSTRIEGIVERLHGLHPRLIDLSLERLQALLAKLGHPERRLPPVVHVAGTNGKGSTCAFVRAIAEAAGWRVHVYTSPHLVRFNERIRIAGRLVSDEALIEALETVERVNAGAPITVFEVITAVALHLFAETPADLCVLEVGLGGRGDATNVIERPAATAITSISLDHRELLGDTLAAIAAEKAGILKRGVPVTVGAQDAVALEIILDRAERVGAPVLLRGRNWRIEAAARPLPQPPPTRGGGFSAPPPLVGGGREEGFGHTCFRYTDRHGHLDLPPPGLPGEHQIDNAGIAIASLRGAFPQLPAEAMARGIAGAEWPARLQRLDGRLTRLLPADWELWLDGGHNPGAGEALGRHLAQWSDRPLHLVVGMKQAKDSAAFLRPLLPYATTIWAIAEPGQHLALPVEAIVAASGGAARPGPTLTAALRQIPHEPTPARVLVCGSLYLAGEVLKQDGAG
ncbi:MAG: bifunctional folylpolyglutamate synthase/dihydrofolate synthase [Alphaproteobacteria bacterium]|nr:bifunctional folylpolyglutamate synthase/dihydrofolate synthase [Alphaproteobacteria bacterium]